MAVVRYPGFGRRAPPEVRLSGEHCYQCGEEFVYGEFVTLVQGVWLEHDAESNELAMPPIISEVGEPLYEPRLFHEGCFDSTLAHMRAAAADVLPIRTTDSWRDCTCCTNSVLLGEKCALVEIGRLEARGGNLHAFEGKRDAGIICMICVNRLADDFEASDAGTEIWDEMAQDQECSSCTDDMCWRDPGCDCPCHDEDEEDDNEEEDEEDTDAAYR